MSDRLAREKAEEEARQQALLRKRSKVLQRELPRPPSASLELIRNSLIRADGDKSSFTPPTSIEQADEMIRKELLSLLEHDNAKYPLDDKMNKEKNKSAKRSAAAIPVIEGYEEDDLKEKLAALQYEFEHVKTRLEAEREKAFRLEKKVKVLTQGYQTRAEGQLLPLVEAILKRWKLLEQNSSASRLYRSKKSWQLSYRINGLWEEVQKQRELEQILQRRNGNLVTDLERLQLLVNDYKARAKQ